MGPRVPPNLDSRLAACPHRLFASSAVAKTRLAFLAFEFLGFLDSWILDFHMVQVNTPWWPFFSALAFFTPALSMLSHTLMT